MILFDYFILKEFLCVIQVCIGKQKKLVQLSNCFFRIAKDCPNIK